MGITPSRIILRTTWSFWFHRRKCRSVSGWMFCPWGQEFLTCSGTSQRNVFFLPFLPFSQQVWHSPQQTKKWEKYQIMGTSRWRRWRIPWGCLCACSSTLPISSGTGPQPPRPSSASLRQLRGPGGASRPKVPWGLLHMVTRFSTASCLTREALAPECMSSSSPGSLEVFQQQQKALAMCCFFSVSHSRALGITSP